jgi:hypothetical protein
MENGKQSAFSCVDTICPDGTRTEPLQVGLTKREYFAGLAMQAIVSNTSLLADKDMVVRNAIYYADELLKQLSND